MKLFRKLIPFALFLLILLTGLSYLQNKAYAAGCTKPPTIANTSHSNNTYSVVYTRTITNPNSTACTYKLITPVINLNGTAVTDVTVKPWSGASDTAKSTWVVRYENDVQSIALAKHGDSNSSKTVMIRIEQDTAARPPHQYAIIFRVQLAPNSTITKAPATYFLVTDPKSTATPNPSSTARPTATPTPTDTPTPSITPTPSTQ